MCSAKRKIVFLLFDCLACFLCPENIFFLLAVFVVLESDRLMLTFPFLCVE